MVTAELFLLKKPICRPQSGNVTEVGDFDDVVFTGTFYHFFSDDLILGLKYEFEFPQA